jgi:hypothetical protein
MLNFRQMTIIVAIIMAGKKPGKKIVDIQAWQNYTDYSKIHVM